MTTTHTDVINYCEPCDLEFTTLQRDSCRLCRLRIAMAAAEEELKQAEPLRIITTDGHLQMQEILNDMSAVGWRCDSFHVVQREGGESLSPTYIALLRRVSYDAESHFLRRAAHVQAAQAYYNMRDEIEAEVTSYREARDGETSR